MCLASSVAKIISSPANISSGNTMILFLIDFPENFNFQSDSTKRNTTLNEIAQLSEKFQRKGNFSKKRRFIFSYPELHVQKSNPMPLVYK